MAACHIMKYLHRGPVPPFLLFLLAVLPTLFLLTPRAARAVTIQRIDGGGTPAPNVAGGGDLFTVFNAAADVWENALLDDFTVTITFSWAPRDGSVLASHTLWEQGGIPHRQTAGQIRFDNDASFGWFLDPTPTLNEEWTTYTETTADLGGGMMNTGRVFSDPLGDAVGRHDLFTVALHEIGHALGMSSANTVFQTENTDGKVDITAPHQCAGCALYTISGSHLNIPTAVLYPSIARNQRKLLTAADILANAQLSAFTSVDLAPSPGLSVSGGSSVPEPGTPWLFATGLPLLGLRIRAGRLRSTFREAVYPDDAESIFRICSAAFSPLRIAALKLLAAVNSAAKNRPGSPVSLSGSVS